MKRTISNILYIFIWVVSLLPMHFFYLLSDILLLIGIVVPPLRYRGKIVRKNLDNSFPQLSRAERRTIELKFYRHLYDTFFETIKLCSASTKWMSKHMKFQGVELLHEEFEKSRSVVVYMGHTGNWEWVSSLPLHLKPQYITCQVYHPLENSITNSIMERIRGRFGAVSIPMESVMRQLYRYKQNGQHFVVGMISDQVPMMRNTHYWTQFLHQYTPVFTGAERIALKLDLSIFYTRMIKERRGHYICKIERLLTTQEYPVEHELTECYFRRLEEDIQKDPTIWLWSHNRWKRTWNDYLNFLEYRDRVKSQRQSKSS